MAVLQIQPAPFFASKNRAFWNLQLAGWGAADRLMLEAKLGLVALLGEADRPATDNDFAIVDA